jgi:peptide-methionine (S)-S-oxide reductase
MSSALATVGGGCFWCTEAAMKELAGVSAVTAGYAGGDTADPSYKDVCRGQTGHAEVVQVEFTPDVISYRDILEVFFATHDPTQLNRQGPDVGSQYRSIILPHSDAQAETAAAVIDDCQPEYEDDIVTEIQPLDTFWPAEPAHQDYFEKNPEDAYCQMHAKPKVEKVRKEFSETARSS